MQMVYAPAMLGILRHDRALVRRRLIIQKCKPARPIVHYGDPFTLRAHYVRTHRYGKIIKITT
jgi:hypothetical protein